MELECPDCLSDDLEIIAEYYLDGVPMRRYKCLNEVCGNVWKVATMYPILNRVDFLPLEYIYGLNELFGQDEEEI